MSLWTMPLPWTCSIASKTWEANFCKNQLIHSDLGPYLFHDVSGLFLRQGDYISEVVEQLAVFAQLKDQEDESVRLENIVKLDCKF